MTDNTSVDAQRAEFNNDDWHLVTDARKRKQIQDRLAQRARRKRLREALKVAKQTLQDSETQVYLDGPAGDRFYRECEATLRLASLNAFDPSPCCTELTTIGPSWRIPSGCPFSIGQPPSMNHELPYPLTVLGALFINGEILGMKCGAPIAAKSSPVSPEVPLPLHPTATQLFVLHCMFLDRFPFPKMRDNAINMSAIIDEEDFTRDIFTMPSFSITPGAPAWDPRAWKIEKYFADKWGFLFY